MANAKAAVDLSSFREPEQNGRISLDRQNDGRWEQLVAFWGSEFRGTGMERNLVRVASFNINNINERLDSLLDWLLDCAFLWYIRLPPGLASDQLVRDILAA